MSANIIVHFGSPGSRSEITPFINGIFADTFPFFAKPLAFLASMRARKKYEHTGFVGEKKIGEFVKKLGDNYFLAAQHGRPSIDEVLEKIESAGHDDLKIIPLFPHAGPEMFGSLVEKFCKLKRRYYRGMKFKWAGPFFDNPLFIEAWADAIKNALAGFQNGPHIIFSAHAVPNDDADYRAQVEQSADSIVKSMNIRNTWSVAYQSGMRFGRWSRPSLIEELLKGNLNCLIAPISFLFDNVETLFDIDRVAVPAAANAATRDIRRVSPPGDSEKIVKMFLEI